MKMVLTSKTNYNGLPTLTRNLIFCLCLGTLRGLELKLHKYDPGNEKTGPKKIMASKDVVVFECLLDHSDDPKAKFVYFQILKQNDPEYEHVCLIDLRTRCGKGESSPVCSCAVVAEHVKHINVSVNASTTLNGAFLRGTVIRSYDNKKFVSEEQAFPVIYDTERSLIMTKALTFLIATSLAIVLFYWFVIKEPRKIKSATLQIDNLNQLRQKDDQRDKEPKGRIENLDQLRLEDDQREIKRNDLIDHMNQLRQECEQMDEEKIKRIENLDQLRQECDQREMERNNLIDHMNQLRQECEQMDKEKIKRIENLVQLRQECYEREMELYDMIDHKNQPIQKWEQMVLEKIERIYNLDKLRQKDDQRDKEQKGLIEHMNQLRQECKQMDKEQIKRIENLDQLRQEFDQKEKERNDLIDKLDQLRQQYVVLRDMKRTLGMGTLVLEYEESDKKQDYISPFISRVAIRKRKTEEIIEHAIKKIDIRDSDSQAIGKGSIPDFDTDDSEGSGGCYSSAYDSEVLVKLKCQKEK